MEKSDDPQNRLDETDPTDSVPEHAVPLTDIEGTGGTLRHQWLEMVTDDGVAPRRGGVRRIAYAIAYHAHSSTFEVWPAVPTLARRIALGENTVRNAYRWLVIEGWLILKSPGGGRALTNRYILSIPASSLENGS